MNVEQHAKAFASEFFTQFPKGDPGNRAAVYFCDTGLPSSDLDTFERAVSCELDRLRAGMILLYAMTDAAIYAVEFPGEPLSGDWDAEAFAMTGLPADSWEEYREALAGQVARLAL